MELMKESHTLANTRYTLTLSQTHEDDESLTLRVKTGDGQPLQTIQLSLLAQSFNHPQLSWRRFVIATQLGTFKNPYRTKESLTALVDLIQEGECLGAYLALSEAFLVHHYGSVAEFESHLLEHPGLAYIRVPLNIKNSTKEEFLIGSTQSLRAHYQESELQLLLQTYNEQRQANLSDTDRAELVSNLLKMDGMSLAYWAFIKEEDLDWAYSLAYSSEKGYHLSETNYSFLRAFQQRLRPFFQGLASGYPIEVTLSRHHRQQALSQHSR